jgi:maltose/moltooligosaccharide transporter
MSAIYSKLGASPDSIPILWLAGPITGLLVQPLNWSHERSHLEQARSAPALLLSRRSFRLLRLALHANVALSAVCRLPTLDSRCQHQH